MSKGVELHKRRGHGRMVTGPLALGQNGGGAAESMGEAFNELKLNSPGPREPFQGFDWNGTALELCFVQERGPVSAGWVGGNRDGTG